VTAARPSTLRMVALWLPVLLYVGIIFTLSSQPHLQPPLHFVNADKLMHLLEYGGLGVLLARALRGGMTVLRPARGAVVAIAIGAGIAATDEWYQSFVPGRQSSVYDALADTVGCALAQVAYARIVRG
jgi:VanZ family protein